MSEVDDLVSKAQRQLEEHRTWLASEIEKIPTAAGNFPMHIRAWMVAQATEIKLRVARTNGRVASVVYEYPDELYAFLRSDVAPRHLRDTIANGHVVDPEQPTFSVKREV